MDRKIGSIKMGLGKNNLGSNLLKNKWKMKKIKKDIQCSNEKSSQDIFKIKFTEKLKKVKNEDQKSCLIFEKEKVCLLVISQHICIKVFILHTDRMKLSQGK